MLRTPWAAYALQEVYFEVIRFAALFEWDYFVNLSEKDFLLGPLKLVTDPLVENPGMSWFNANYNANEKEAKDFVERQGLTYAFQPCGRFGYRLGRRTPPDFRFIGGSDWFILARDYALYAATDTSPFMQEYRRWYKYTIMSPESMLHTLAANTKWCSSTMWTNRRFENWIAGKGCFCKKTAVDWCGCSPMVLRSSDLRTLRQNRRHRPIGRKFDPRIDMNIMALLERDAGPAQPGAPFLQTHYWGNTYHADDEGTKALATAAWTMGVLRNASREGIPGAVCGRIFEPKRVLSVHQHFVDPNAPGAADCEADHCSATVGGVRSYFRGLVVRFEALLLDGTPGFNVEMLLVPRGTPPGPDRSTLRTGRGAVLTKVAVRSGYNEKDEVFSGFGAVFVPGEKVQALHRWIPDPIALEAKAVGCFRNPWNARWTPTNKIDGRTYQECAFEALSRGKRGFGLEYPEGFSKRQAECTIFDIESNFPPRQHTLKHSQCQQTTDKEHHGLGGRLIVAVYQLTKDSVKKARLSVHHGTMMLEGERTG